MAGTDSGVSTRTWQNALDAIVESNTGLVFATHEVSLRGHSLRRVETAMQRMELAFLTALPEKQRPLIADGQPVIFEIIAKEANDDSKETVAEL